MRFSFRFDAETLETGDWKLTRDSPAGERCLPLDEFLACFDPSAPPDAPADDPVALRERLAALDWDSITVTDWGLLQVLLGGIDGGAWAAFAADGGRQAAERQLAGEVKSSRKPQPNPYGPGDLERGEEILTEIFSERGHLARLIGESFEPREGQLQMALAVWQSFLGGSHLVAEAPTGIGKSLAYLIPAGLFALMTGERVILSTHTRNLQDQLLRKDLPELCAADWFPVSPALLMGRENYICQRYVDRRLGEPGEGRRDRLAAAALLVWRARSHEGLSDELAENALLSGPPISELRARTQGADEARCAARADCWVTRARERARGAQIVVVNHSLLLADHAVAGGILGDYSYLVVDEAHRLEEVATRALGLSLSLRELDTLIRIAAPEYAQLRWSQRSLNVWLPVARELAERDKDVQLRALRDELLAGLLVLRQDFRELLAEIVSLPELGQALAKAGRLRYREEQGLGEALAQPVFRMHQTAAALADGAGKLAAELDQARLETKSRQEARLEAEQLSALARALAEFRARLDTLLAGAGDDFVFYLEGDGEGGLRELAASPVDVSHELGDYFRERLEAAILTSATLSVQGSFDYFQGKIGLERAGKEFHSLDLASPFDYKQQARVLLPAYLPEPGRQGHLETVASLLAELARRFPLNTLVLFTSYRALDSIRRGLLEQGLAPERLLHQAPGQPRDALARRFRRSEGAILLGTSSFWEGVDFPGESLKILVLSRLPFAVPTEPLVEARCERVARDGGEPFFDYMVPEAVLRFKQGFGRLIRNSRDEGIILLLDSRLSHKGYGQRFLSSLPAKTRICFDPSSFRNELHEWYISRPRPTHP